MRGSDAAAFLQGVLDKFGTNEDVQGLGLQARMTAANSLVSKVTVLEEKVSTWKCNVALGMEVHGGHCC